MTRRRAFTIAVQGLGGTAGAAIVLPAVGLAVAPTFHRGKERWQAAGPAAAGLVERRRAPPASVPLPAPGQLGGWARNLAALIPAPLRKPAKPGAGNGAKGPAPADLKTAPPERPSDSQRLGERAKE